MTINYSKQVLLKRGNSAVSSTYVGPLGEVTVDTDFATIRVHDGVTPGGHLSTSSASGATPPENPRESSIWYDTVGGRLYVYYDGAWVDASPSGDLFLAANVANLSAQVTGLTSDVANVETHIDSLDANIGAFETAVNVTVGTLNANINTLNQTIAAFESNVGPTSDAWVDDAPPDISNVGALWYDAESGRLYVYYDGAWIDANPPVTTGFGNVLPSANVTYSLGSEQYQWKDLWVSSNTIYIGNTPITVSNGSLSVGGSVVSGGGGGANTGLIAFDSYTTSAGIYNSQGGEVIISNFSYVTAEAETAWIQIPAGNSTNELRVVQEQGNVAVRANNKVWTFGTDGNLTLPTGANINYANGRSILSNQNLNTTDAATFANVSATIGFISQINGTNPGGELVIQTNGTHNWNFTANGELALPDSGGDGVSIIQSAHNIEFNANGKNWNFATDGNLTLPTGARINYANGRSILSGLGGGGTPAGNNGEIQFNSNGAFGSSDTLYFTDDGGEMTLFTDYLNSPGIFTNSIYGSDNGNVANLTITTTNGTNWTFGTNGTLTLPGKLWARASDSGSIAFTNNGVDEHGYLKVDAGYNMLVNAESNFYVKRAGTDRIAITDTASDFKAVTDVRLVSNLAGSNKTWNFAASGIATLPSSSYLETTDANLKIGSQGTVTIRANAATGESTRSWTFGTNGATTFPGNISVPGNLSTIAGFAFYNGDPISIVATEPINSIRFIQPYYIEIAKTGLPAGFDTLLGSGTWTVTANSSTFTVVSVESNGDYWRITVAENPNGTISRIATFNRAASGANIVIPSTGSITFANGVNILSTVGNYGNTNVAAYINNGFSINNGAINFTSSPPAYSSPGIQWPGGMYQSEYYGNTQVGAYLTTYGGNIALGNASVTGNVTTGNISATQYNFTNGANILANVATKVISSWTVATGTNTYSFTVPLNGTYLLWVLGNIPSGIIAWNATATVTNNNVPVVGAQYAWVYDGDGTPIDFTSIPNQFAGTANTIVRSSSSPGITTNRFDFGINNTSGGAVTVTYGYIKLNN